MHCLCERNDLRARRQEAFRFLGLKEVSLEGNGGGAARTGRIRPASKNVNVSDSKLGARLPRSAETSGV